MNPMEDMRQRLMSISSNFIALICTEENCDVAKVIPRYSTDHPTASSVHLPCVKHEGDGEGHIPYYFDEDGNELSGDPHTWPGRTA
jgi:hypothetical protein